ncbi:MAG: tyrosine-type recombinase/integrase [Bacteroidetes bacterium]|nr:tyrosine-type recombinase/integrase [Bacteroidota bacterium]
MQSTDFSRLFAAWSRDYLRFQRNLSSRTVGTYMECFRLFLRYCVNKRNLRIECITISMINRVLILEFLTWMEKESNWSPQTWNLRLAALKSFCRYVQSEQPESILSCQKILLIPHKKETRKLVQYLSTDRMRLLLAQPERTTAKGLRHFVIIATLYDAAARVQELLQLTVKDFYLDSHPFISLHGKGRKDRRVPILDETASFLKKYFTFYHRVTPDQPVFSNSRGEKMTKEGISYILNKYAAKARNSDPEFPHLHPHLLRHTKTMHLVQAGVSDIYIRDFLGHENLSTTGVYTRADLEMKRKAQEKVEKVVIKDSFEDWNENPDLVNRLLKLAEFTY